MKLYSIDKDLVIKGYFATGRVNYKYAHENLIGLIDKLDFQRKFQNERFYQRLEIDLQQGCIMPAITIAFVSKVDMNVDPKKDIIEDLLKNRIKEGFILDGIQRLNTLKRVINKPNHTLNLEKHLYLNIIVCPIKDNLLYRMITLNNGQKPMTARHQIEILASSLYDFNGYGFDVTTEKEQHAFKAKGAFKKSDLVNSYISFLSNSTSLDNKKIIEKKLDELVARKIIESKLTDSSIDFNLVLKLIGKLSESQKVKEWLRNGNNLVGFTVSLRTSYQILNEMTVDKFESEIEKYEAAFKNINVSKIKVSRERKRLANFYFSNILKYESLDSDELTLVLAEEA